MNTLRITRNSLYSIVGSLVPVGVAVWALPNIARGLGREVYAVFLIGVSLLTASQVFTTGISVATSKYLSDESLGTREKHELLGSSFLLHMMIGVISLVLMNLLLPIFMDIANIPKILENLKFFRFIILSFPLFLITSFVRAVMEGYFDFHLSNAIRVTSQSGLFVVSGIGALLYRDVKDVGKMIFIWLLLTTTLSVVLFIFKYARKHHFMGVSYGGFRMLLKYGGWASIPGILGPLWIIGDRSLLNRFATPIDVAVYGTAIEILSRVWILPAGFSSALLPEVSSQWQTLSQKNIVKSSLYRFTLLVGVMMFPVFFFLGWHSGTLLQWWLKDEVLAAGLVPVFKILSIGAWVNSMARIPASFLRGFDRVDYIGKITAIEFIVYYLVALSFVKAGGSIGMATLFSFRLIVDGWLLWAGAQHIGERYGSETFIRVPR